MKGDGSCCHFEEDGCNTLDPSPFLIQWRAAYHGRIVVLHSRQCGPSTSPLLLYTTLGLLSPSEHTLNGKHGLQRP